MYITDQKHITPPSFLKEPACLKVINLFGFAVFSFIHGLIAFKNKHIFRLGKNKFDKQ